MNDQIPVTLSPAGAQALKRVQQRCLYLARESPNIAAVLDLDPDTIELAQRALERIENAASRHPVIPNPTAVRQTQ